MTAHDDAALLARISEGNASAFAALVERHNRRFYALAYRFTMHRQEAEDVVQDAFLKLWERPDQWQADRNTRFTTWFYRVVVNLCLDRKKRKRPLPLAEDFDMADDRPSQEESFSGHQQRKLLESAIADLPERQRVALNLCFYEGLSNQEAADVMQLNLKALQSLLMRAKATLKETFARMI